MPDLDPDDDLDRLEGELMVAALYFLTKKGRFWPFGAVVWADGEAQIAAAPVDPAHRHPSSEELRQGLIRELRGDATAGRIRAAGLAADTRRIEVAGHGSTDAVRLHLECADGRAETRTVVYDRRFPRRFRIDPTTASEATDREIFR